MSRDGLTAVWDPTTSRTTTKRGQVQFRELIGNALAGVAKLDLSPFLPSAEIWCRLVKDCGRLFSVVAGQPQRIDEHRPKGSSCRYRTRQETRELLATV